MTADVSKYEGLQANVRDMDTPAIDTWENMYADKHIMVSIQSGQGEVTSICPKTALPDFATVHIDYIPDKLCIELKSLKEYYLFYRDIGIFHEHLTNRILDDFVTACRPRYAKVSVDMNPRGNIHVVCDAEHGVKGVI